MPEPERDPTILAARLMRRIPGSNPPSPGELIEDPVMRRKYQASVRKKAAAKGEPNVS